MSAEKRTKDLTAEDINTFSAKELKYWMGRILDRLFKLVDRSTYDRLSQSFAQVSAGGVEYVKKGLIQLVEVIKKLWRDETPEPDTIRNAPSLQDLIPAIKKPRPALKVVK